MSRFGDWVDRRLPYRQHVKAFTDEPIQGGAKFFYVLGSVTLLDFVILALTGIWQLAFYVPSTATAYASVNFMRFEVPFGWLLHGLHFWAANLMVILALAHLGQVFVWGAYKKPREVNWILGVLLLLTSLLAIFTGGPLPWDEKGFWAAKVGSGLAASIPVVGTAANRLVFGSANVGQLALSRLFGLHVAVVPVILAALIALHLVAFRRVGAAGSFAAEANKKPGSFWPTQVLMDSVAFAAVFTALVGLSALLLTPVTGPADPIDATYVARPAWPFLWLFEVLRLLPGSLEAAVTLVLPIVGVVLLLAVPWLDRGEERRPSRRPVAMGLFAVVVVGLVVLSIAGGRAGQVKPAPPTGPPPATTAESAISTAPVPAGPSQASLTIGGEDHGADIYVEFCQVCHGPKGTDNVANPGTDDKVVPELNPMDPELKSKDSQMFVDNIDPFIQAGSLPEGPSPRVVMPSFGNSNALTQQQIADVEAYVLKLNGATRAVIVRAGIEPKPFFYGTLGAFVIVVLLSAAALATRRG